jgi:hypothetical protein
MNRFAIYTGPTLVQWVAEKLRQKEDITVTIEGTAHVHVATPYSRDYVLGLMPSIGSGWTHRDIRQLP